MSEISVGIDVSPLSQTGAGVHRYITSLVGELEATGTVAMHRFGFAGGGRLTSVVRDVAWYLSVLPRAARREGVDLLHCPTQRAPTHSTVPLLVTIHDL